MTIQAKADHLLHVARVGGGDAGLFAEISIYEAERAAKWAVLARDHYSDEEHGEAADAESEAFAALAELPATTLTGLLAKMLIVLEDAGRPDDEMDFANLSCHSEAVIKSLIADLSRLGIEWTPRGEPAEWAATVKARSKRADDGDDRLKDFGDVSSAIDCELTKLDEVYAIVLPALEDLQNGQAYNAVRQIYGAVTILDYMKDKLNSVGVRCRVLDRQQDAGQRAA